MKKYLAENWSTVLLIAGIAALLGTVIVPARGFVDPLTYVAVVIPIALLAAGIYGRSQRTKGKETEV